MPFRQRKHRLTPIRTTSPTKIALLGGVAVAVVAAAIGIPATVAPAAAQSFVVDRPVASDSLNRTTTSGWGSAPVGGAYKHSASSHFASNGTVGLARLPHSGASLTAALPSVSALDTVAQTVVSLPALPTKGSGIYAGLQLRASAGSYYQAQVRMTPTGTAGISLLRVNGSTANQSTLAAEKSVLKGITPTSRILIEFQVTGTGPVTLSARAWVAGTTKPAWQTTATDTSLASLKGAGSIALWSYVSGSTPAQAVSFDDLAAYALKPASPSPQPPVIEPVVPPVTPPVVPPVVPPVDPTPPTVPPVTPPTSPVDPSVPVDASTTRGQAGAAPIGSATYAVPSGAIVVATNGTASGAGTIASPLASVQKAIDKAASGGTVVLRAGSYHESILLPKGKAVTVQAYPGEEVWLDGSRVITSWAKSGSAWVTGWDIAFDTSPTYTRGAPDNTAESWAFLNPAYPLAAHPDQVWVDSEPLVQVASLSKVTAGTFFVDTAAKKLYLGSDPSGHSVRASDIVKAATVLGDGSALKGIGIRRFAPSVPDMGAVTVYAKNVLIENVAITDNATTGLSLGASGIRLNKVTVARNGMLGVHANYADDLRVNGLLTSGNNAQNFNRAPVSGGMKVTRSRGITVANSAVINNAGNALWFDESVYDVTVTGTDILANTGNGLVFELSSKLVFANNIVANNGLSGALISDSNQAEVWNNTFTGNARNVNIVQGDRRASNVKTPGHDPRQPLPDPTVTWITGHVTVKNNVLAASTFKCNLCVEDFSHEKSAAQMNIVSDGNVFQRTSASLPSWVIVWSRGAGNPAVYTTVAQFVKETGHDASSLVLEGEAALGGRFTAAPKVAAAMPSVAHPLPGNIAHLVGQAPGVKHLGAWIG